MHKLEVVNVTKSYNRSSVLEGVSFTVEDGEFLSILGPSGCGKTTMLRLLLGLEYPDSGKIYKDGVDVTKVKPSQRGIGVVFQNYALFENMTAIQNVQYALKKNKSTRQMSRDRAERMISLVGLRGHENKRPSKLSGGQQQRVAIARTLALSPDVVLFDEPMSALDVETRLSLRQQIKNLQKELGTTMIYITHDQEEAFAMSDRIMVMSEGKIHQIGTPQEILGNPVDDYVQSFVINNLKTKISSLSKYWGWTGE